MSYAIDSLEPKVVWKYFDRIRQIPHGSTNTKELGRALAAWARENGCQVLSDPTGNTLIRVPPSPGCENAPTVILQGHQDMVCEKDAETEFDFEKQPLVLERDGDWLQAKGTTLGADNGIGMAIALSFMELADSPHGPLELLFTTDEETGLVGARSLSSDFVTGRLLFNLDSEEDGVFYVGCAGGRDSSIELPIRKNPAPKEYACYKIQIKGLRGGHSGLDIIQNRGNAIRLLSRALIALSKQVRLSLASVEGGDKHNAIPREATAIAFVEAGRDEEIEQILKAQQALFLGEFESAEPNLRLTAEHTAAPAQALDPASQDLALNLITGLPTGVLAMNRDLVGTVETSTNVARVRTEEDSLTVLSSTRSSVASGLAGAIDQLSSVAHLADASIKVDEGYPAWQPDMNSKMLAEAKAVWRSIHGSDAEITIIHAGLECGIIGEKYPGMDMISLGPTIENAHSPEERVSIPTVARLFEFTKAFLTALAMK